MEAGIWLAPANHWPCDEIPEFQEQDTALEIAFTMQKQSLSDSFEISYGTALPWPLPSPAQTSLYADQSPEPGVRIIAVSMRQLGGLTRIAEPERSTEKSSGADFGFSPAITEGAREVLHR